MKWRKKYFVCLFVLLALGIGEQHIQAVNANSDESEMTETPAASESVDENSEVEGNDVTTFTPTIHFIDSDSGEEVGILSSEKGSGITVDKETKAYKFADPAPEGYVYDFSREYYYKTGDSLTDTNIYVKKKIKDGVHVIVNRHISGSENKELNQSEEKYVSSADDMKSLFFEDLSNNPNYSPIINDDSQAKLSAVPWGNGFVTTYGSLMGSLEGITKDALNFYEQGGITLIIDFYYQDYNDDPNNDGKKIEYNLTVPSNLDSKLVPTVNCFGKLGESLEVAVPVVKGYRSDKEYINAKVNVDGTITTDDQVKYTKIASSNHSSGHSKPKVEITNTDMLVATIADNKSYHVDQKKVTNGQTYYRIGDGQWLNSDEVYSYQDVRQNVRTYSDSYKMLINSQSKVVKNRALAKASDWLSDRVAIFNVQEYYRVATNEWVSSEDAFAYQSLPNIVNIPAQTVVYNERGQQVRIVNKVMSFKADRMILLNDQKAYRVASNEYVLANNTF